MQHAPRTIAVALTVATTLAWLPGCTGGPPEEAPPEEPPAPPIQEPAPVKLGHFLCYESTAEPSPVYPQVQLRDQFYRDWIPFNLLPGGERFCNPVAKTHQDREHGIPDRDHHLVAIHGGSPGETPQEGWVTVVNQFFPKGQRLVVSTTERQYLMVPTHKTGIDPSPDEWREHAKPAGLNHFKCYPAAGDAPGVPVDLTDQADAYPGVMVGDPALLCNPTAKRHDGDHDIEPVDGDDHLVCYDVERDKGIAFLGNHQLDRAGRLYPARALEWLCAPSSKQRGDGWWDTPPG